MDSRTRILPCNLLSLDGKYRDWHMRLFKRTFHFHPKKKSKIHWMIQTNLSLKRKQLGRSEVPFGVQELSCQTLLAALIRMEWDASPCDTHRKWWLHRSFCQTTGWAALSVCRNFHWRHFSRFHWSTMNMSWTQRQRLCCYSLLSRFSRIWA